MHDLEVIAEPGSMVAALAPPRPEILRVLARPGSATTVAGELGLTRQQVNYHLQALAKHGLIELVEERPRRGMVEKIMQSRARGFLISPIPLGGNQAELTSIDRWSARYLVALAARAVREISDLVGKADRAEQTLPTLAIDTDLKFASAAARAAFTEELAAAVHHLAAKYHDEAAPQGRWHRLMVGAYPRPAPQPPMENS